jgi:hypothetical protein
MSEDELQEVVALCGDVLLPKRYAIKRFYTHRRILAIRPHRPSLPFLDRFPRPIREFLSK